VCKTWLVTVQEGFWGYLLISEENAWIFEGKMNKELGNVYRCNTSGVFTLLLSLDFKFLNNLRIKHQTLFKMCHMFYAAHNFLPDLQLIVLNCNTVASIPRKFIAGLCVIMVEWSYELCFKEHYVTLEKLLFIVGWMCSWHSCFSHRMMYYRFLCLDHYQFLWLHWLSCTCLGKIQMHVLVPLKCYFFDFH